MLKTTLVLAAAILVLNSLSGPARAENYPVPVPAIPGAAPHRVTPRQVFAWLDTNHDGYLTMGEYLAAPWITNQAQARRFFHWMDANKDGVVSLPEFLAAYNAYSGTSGYAVRTAYPWAWTFWRPWQYGWYWNSGWHRRPGNWPGYAVARSNGVVNGARVTGHTHTVAKGAGHPKLARAVSHAAAGHKVGGHKSAAHGHGKSHGGHHK
jgi:hypothetical protein